MGATASREEAEDDEPEDDQSGRTSQNLVRTSSMHSRDKKLARKEYVTWQVRSLFLILVLAWLSFVRWRRSSFCTAVHLFLLLAGLLSHWFFPSVWMGVKRDSIVLPLLV